MKQLKRSKKIISVFCAVFVGLFALLATGCTGNSSTHHQDLIDRFEKGEITEDQLENEMKNSQTVPMYGTKVLYRPDHYDYDSAVGEGNQEYYGQYAWQILRYLIWIYGFSDYPEYINDNTQEYYYDSIRYHIQNSTQFDKIIQYVQDENGNIEFNGVNYTQIDTFDDVVTITADTSYGWNWTFGVTAEPQGFILDEINSIAGISTSSTLIANTYFQDTYKDSLTSHYLLNQTSYLAAYLTNDPDKPNTQQSIDNYSDYVKALEYVIYCITMDLTPANITTSIDAAGNPIVNVQGFANVDAALEFIKGVFDKIGTYVGINSYKAARITSYILNNVIGQNAINHDSVAIAHADEIKEYYDADGNLIGTETVGLVNDTPVTIGRNYAFVVSEIVNDVCTYVQIGSDSADIITNRFPASEVIDYYGNNFFIASDDGNEFANILPLEYQSVVFMLSEEQTIDNLMLHFKYDAGEDGDDVYDANASITINVKVNVFKYGEGWKQAKTESITVKDGPFNFGEENSTLCLFGIDPSGVGFTVGAFNPEIGDGILKGMEYNGKTDISEAIRLVGTTELKNWYKLVEPEPTDEAQNVYYSYGILDYTKFEGSDGCDYMEIAYEVIKTTGDYSTNYKFYTGLGLVA